MTGYLHVKDQPPNPKRMCRRGCIEYPDGQWALCAWHEGRAQWAATNTHRHDRASCPQCAALVRTPETPVADTAGVDAALDDADVRIRAAEPPTHATDEFKAGWHHAVSASLTAVARARRAAALRTPKPEGEPE